MTKALAVIAALATATCLPSAASAATVTLKCVEDDGNRTVNFTFDPTSHTADVFSGVTNQQGVRSETAAVAELVASPSTAIFSFRDSRSARVFVDHRYEVNRTTLRFSGSVVMPGYMNIQFSGNCRVDTQAPTNRAF